MWSRRWCSCDESSRFNLASRNGHRAMIVKITPGTTTPGMNGDGIVTPRIVGSNGGEIRSAPSSQPTYQSGWAGELTTVASNGPYTQMGLTWTRPPITETNAAVRKNSPVETKTWPGQNEGPMTFVFVARPPLYWVCLWITTNARWTV